MEHNPLGTGLSWVKKDQLILPTIGVDQPDALIENLSFDEYNNDRTRMRSSLLRKMIKSPRDFLAEAMGHVDEEEQEKDHFRFGRAAHMLILEPEKFRKFHVIEPEFVGMTKDGRPSTQSKEAKEKKQAWYDSLPPGALVIKEKEMEHLMHMADALMEHKQASRLLINGKSEVTGHWTHRETGVACKFRADHLAFVEGKGYFLPDFKTARTVAPGLFANDVARFMYHVQLAFYADGFEQITGEQLQGVAIIAAEKTPPYHVVVYWLNDEDLAKGRQWYEFALRTYARCMKSWDWPGLQGNAQMLSLPRWTDNETFPQYEWQQPQEVSQ